MQKIWLLTKVNINSIGILRLTKKKNMITLQLLVIIVKKKFLSTILSIYLYLHFILSYKIPRIWSNWSKYDSYYLIIFTR